MKTIELIREIMAGKMLVSEQFKNQKGQTTYGLSNRFNHYGNLEAFLKDTLDWVVYEPPVYFNDLKVGEKFKFNGNDLILEKISISNNKNISYGYEVNSCLYRTNKNN